MANKEKGQILSKIERIHSRIRYLGKKRELGKCKKTVKEFEKEY